MYKLCQIDSNRKPSTLCQSVQPFHHAIFLPMTVVAQCETPLSLPSKQIYSKTIPVIPVVVNSVELVECTYISLHPIRIASKACTSHLGLSCPRNGWHDICMALVLQYRWHRCGGGTPPANPPPTTPTPPTQPNLPPTNPPSGPAPPPTTGKQSDADIGCKKCMQWFTNLQWARRQDCLIYRSYIVAATRNKYSVCSRLHRGSPTAMSYCHWNKPCMMHLHIYIRDFVLLAGLWKIRGLLEILHCKCKIFSRWMGEDRSKHIHQMFSWICDSTAWKTPAKLGQRLQRQYQLSVIVKSVRFQVRGYLQVQT